MANNLLVDIGNTSVKWSVMEANTPLLMSQQQYPHLQREAFFTEQWQNLEKPARVLVSCVADTDVWDALESTVESLWNLKAEKVIADSSGYGVLNAYQSPAELGSDRWCALIGAYHTANTAVVAVDCGSAITIDVANTSGVHLGGYILPGITMMKKSLGLNTAQIDVETAVTHIDNLLPAKSTTACVNVAAIFAAVSLIEAVFQQQLDQYPDIQCLLTGGDADLIAEYLTIEYIKLPDLVLRGMAVMAEQDQE